MSNQILQGDALAELRKLPDNLVQTVVTSPPYYGLRDYGVSGQIGLEETPDAYINRLVEVFREVRRVLRDDGTCWVNIGDSYAGYWGDKKAKEEGRRSSADTNGWTNGFHMNARPGFHIAFDGSGIKPKDLIGIPWMLAFALRADGWWLRSDIIWSKPNAMPESVEDRPTKAHEYIFLLSKSERYFYDAQAIREPLQESTIEREKAGYMHAFASQFRGSPNDKRFVDGKVIAQVSSPLGRNKRTVWTVASQPYSEAHFATFPPKLIEPCILAGTSPRACEQCGAPWARVTERIQFGKANSDTKFDDTMQGGPLSRSRQAYRAMGLEGPPAPITTGWQPTCPCKQEGTGTCIVLDPFMGAGTTALVALRHSRAYLGVELNPEYITLAEKRIAYVQQNLWDVAWMESEVVA